MEEEPARSMPARHARPLIVAGALLMLARAARSRGAAPARASLAAAAPARAASDDDDWSSYVDLFDELTGSVKTSTVEYAQCYTGFCTLNGDNITASCGCLSLRPSAANEGKLDLGWGSAVLAASSKFRKVANLSLEGDDDAAITELEAAIADGSLWDEYDFDTTPSRVSLYSSDNPYFDQSVTHCSDVYAAQCMGAPCWDTPYDSIWNVTCICPYHHESYVGVTDMRDDMCEDAKEDTGCAAIGFGVGATTYSAEDLEEMVDAVVAVSASPVIDESKCPAKGNGYDEGVATLAGSLGR